jgi:lipopolysaccharide transport system ATP-binding protein
MEPAIRVENLGKRYYVSQNRDTVRYKTFRESLTNALLSPFRRFTQAGDSGPVDEFWALKDVSFDIQPGEVVGIIGRNGAGKSTLLKILSRITKPTTGRIEINGRVGSLLEVGTGFHPELTGRENIYLNGSILGMSRAEIKARFDEIVAFAEIEQFLDTPVKRYSSGMYVRLAFAVAAHLQPEILIVDEVLAVGDAAFQKKCLGKMQDVAQQGRTVLFVSHNMQAVSTLCDRSVVLRNGVTVYIGKVLYGVRQYLSEQGDEDTHSWAGDAGDDTVRLIATVLQATGNGIIRTDEPLRIGVTYQVLQPVLGLVCAVEIYNQHRQRLVYSAVDDGNPPPAPVVSPGLYQWELTVPPNIFAAGDYRIEFDLGIHNVRYLTRNVGGLAFRMENLEGVGRRFLGHDNVIRPNWRWRQVNSDDGVTR